jgi:Terpene synthase family 2, C-terminal metal binding
MLTDTQQAVDGLHMPFAGGLNPRIELVRKQHHDWIDAMGIAPSATEDIGADLPYIIGRLYPHASADNLALVTDWNCWGFLYDDQFDGDLGMLPHAATASVEAMIDIICAPDDRHGHRDAPLARALADMMQRFRSRTSARWFHRFSEHFAAGLAGFAHHAAARAAGGSTTVEDYLAHRRLDIVSDPLLDFIELTDDCELSPVVHTAPTMLRLRRSALDIIIMTNDIFSYHKERRCGDTENAILVMERSTGLTHEDATARAAEIANQNILALVGARHTLPATLRNLNTSPDQIDRAMRFLTGVQTVVKATYDIHIESTRYDGALASPV